MRGAKLQSIGIQALTVALLALAVMAYLKTVIAGPPPAKVVRPVSGAVSPTKPAMPADRAAEPAGRPEAVSPGVNEPWSAPGNPLPDAASFQGKSGDHRFDHLILRAARDYGIDPAVIKAVIMAESGFDPQAVSHAGAQGLMQLMPRTAEALDVGNALDPQANILGGTRYLKRLLERFEGNLELALAAYNAGSRNVRRHNGVPPFKATRRYIAKIKIYHRYYRQQGFSFPSRVVAAVPPEWQPFGPLAVARYLTLFSSLVRTAT
jgi:soluble lytic murein transglycosylase-like protein